MNIHSEIGAKIKELRKKNKDTLKQLAEKVDYDYSNLSKVERGKYTASVELLKKITEVYGVEPNYFFGEGFTQEEENLLLEEDLETSRLKQKYNFEVDGIEATEEEIKEAIRLIRMLRGE